MSNGEAEPLPVTCTLPLTFVLQSALSPPARGLAGHLRLPLIVPAVT